MAKTNGFENSGHNQISKGTSIVGDVKSEYDIRIDGSLEGNLDTKGKLVLGSSGSITGNIVCKNCVVEGKVDGTIKVAELLTLKSTGFFKGDIATSKLQIEPGAKFTGNSNMTGNTDNTLFNGPGKDKAKEEAKKDK